jgi:hypothetical protein
MRSPTPYQSYQTYPEVVQRHGDLYVRRTGPMAWWLNLTAPPRRANLGSTDERERIRKAELTSYLILAVFFFLGTLVSNSLADPSTGQAVGAMAVVLFIAAILNRTGEYARWRTSVAGFLVPGFLLLLLIAAIVQAVGGLRLIWLPAFDLLALPIFLSSLNGTWRTPWIFFTAAVAFIVADFLLQPHALINAVGATNFDDIAHETKIFGVWGMINRPIGLCFFAALVGSIAAYSVWQAIRRADRAEEIARLEHTLADQKRQLDVGIQQILQTHVRAANGDYSARAPLGQDNLLWQIASSLNNLLNRLQRSGQAEHLYRRVEEEARRLAAAIDDAQSGRKPIWPAPTGTPIDLILERIRGARRAPQPMIQEQPSGYGPSQPMSGFQGGPRSGWPDVMPQQMPSAQGSPSGWPEQTAPPQLPMEPAQQGGWPGQQPDQQPAQPGGWPEPVVDQGGQDANPWTFPQDER